jgi:hypothetical protein
MKLWFINNSHLSLYVTIMASILAILGTFWSQWASHQKELIEKNKIKNSYFNVLMLSDFIDKDEIIVSAHNPSEVPIQAAYCQIIPVLPDNLVVQASGNKIGEYFRIIKYPNICIPPKKVIEIGRIQKPPFGNKLKYDIYIYCMNGITYKEILKLICLDNWEGNGGRKWISWGEIGKFVDEKYEKIKDFESYHGFPDELKNTKNFCEKREE